ncbi:MAG TPA: hypothetical protein ENF34_03935 [Candidatus Bathyarchaeota archaeon]|nr:hypothetical protein [Candidatus Bathyarchaeota archaeon]
MSGAEAVEREGELVLRIKGKEIAITEEVLEVLQEYVRTGMRLEELARRLGLSGWMEAFELVKAIPAWILWTPPPFLKRQLGASGGREARAEGSS